MERNGLAGWWFRLRRIPIPYGDGDNASPVQLGGLGRARDQKALCRARGDRGFRGGGPCGSPDAAAEVVLAAASGEPASVTRAPMIKLASHGSDSRTIIAHRPATVMTLQFGQAAPDPVGPRPQREL